MQLKGLVRFFTVLLIIYSLYQLSFTWFVRNHEKKMEAVALRFVNAQYPETRNQKLADFSAAPKELYDTRLREILDNTKPKILTYGINGGVSYQKAKEEELNLGLAAPQPDQIERMLEPMPIATGNQPRIYASNTNE